MTNQKENNDDGSIEFIMSSSDIESAIRAQQPKQAYLAKWFEQTLSSDYRGNPCTGKFHIKLTKKVNESEKGIQIETIVSDPFGKVIKTENKWYPKKAIENIECL
jgi:hypothetical protein